MNITFDSTNRDIIANVLLGSNEEQLKELVICYINAVIIGQIKQDKKNVAVDVEIDGY